MASVSSGRPLRSREISPSALTIRNVVVAGHRTSVRLEPVMWDALRDIARGREMPVNDLVTEIAQNLDAPGLTAAIRVYIVDFYRSAAGIGITRSLPSESAHAAVARNSRKSSALASRIT
jgi:predicted DNA-binding ribbon-helix-helix protein